MSEQALLSLFMSPERAVKGKYVALCLSLFFL